MTVVNNCGDVALLLLTLHDFGQRAGRSPAKLCLKFPSPGTTPLIVREQTLSHVCTQRGRAIFTLVSLFVSFAYQIVRCWLERYFVVEFSDLYFRVCFCSGFRFFGFSVFVLYICIGLRRAILHVSIGLAFQAAPVAPFLQIRKRTSVTTATKPV